MPFSDENRYVFAKGKHYSAGQTLK